MPGKNKKRRLLVATSVFAPLTQPASPDSLVLPKQTPPIRREANPHDDTSTAAVALAYGDRFPDRDTSKPHGQTV
jgi:hypothetical protein